MQSRGRGNYITGVETLAFSYTGVSGADVQVVGNDGCVTARNVVAYKLRASGSGVMDLFPDQITDQQNPQRRQLKVTMAPLHICSCTRNWLHCLSDMYMYAATS